MIFRKANATNLPSDVSRLLDDLREVLSPNAAPAVSMFTHTAASTLAKVRTASSNAIEQSKAIVLSTDSYVHESPWRVAGGALALGAVIGFTLSRR
ncbi:DUF883 family protein [Comamonas testosteroni]|nr:DUF883 family protein [Comamonas testosteroni]TYK68024.1 DUF883 family protein [Comamonas sp. Z3]WQG69325.1 DUF883 family protein [Comamonas testosteroni]